jgi:hypothetical protein
LLPHSCVAPSPEVLVDCLPGWQIMRQHSPGAAGSEQVKDGISYLAYRILTFAPCVLRRREEWLKQCPLFIAQVSRVGFACCLCCAHPLALHHLLSSCQRC